MDFVALIAARVIKGHITSSNSINDDSVKDHDRKVKFILYASFKNEATAIGLELCQLLHDFCAKRKLDDF
jgi:hypothetical protein